MHYVIMGCGRVGAELTVQLSQTGHSVSVIDKRSTAFDRLPPGFDAKKVVGIGFDRETLEEAGIQQADAFIAVSNGDNSNIVSARVAREHYKIDRVIARIYDPRRAEIYERLHIPTVATVRWAAKQIQFLLFHGKEEMRDTVAGGSLLMMAVTIPKHLVGAPIDELTAEGEIDVIGVDRGGSGFIPVEKSTFHEGDVAHIVVHKDALTKLDALLVETGD